MEESGKKTGRLLISTGLVTEELLEKAGSAMDKAAAAAENALKKAKEALKKILSSIP